MIPSLRSVSLCAILFAGCASNLPESPPPLRGMVEPLELFEPPRDDAARLKLPLGCFTGCYVGESASQSLENLLGDDEAGADGGLTVARIVENSPADAAGLRVGDLLLEAGIDDAPPRALEHPSAWRELELTSRAGQQIRVVFDRANRQARTAITVIGRVHPTDRVEIDRLREERRVGVVVRTATEVEARSAGLAPGGGAVVVGLDKRSPWRAAGIRFGDLVTTIDNRRVEHPEVILDAIRTAGDELVVGWVRDGRPMQATTSLSERAHETRELSVPLLLSYSSDRGKSDTSFLLGLFRYESTEAAWRLRLLWLFSLGGGDADRLIEVER